MTFKAVAYIAAGVALGFALGGIPARRELAAVSAERDALQTRLAALSRPNLLQAFLPGLSGPAASPDDRADTPGAGAAQDGSARRAGGEVDALPAPRGDVAVIGSAERAKANGQSPGSAPGAPASAPAAPATDAARTAPGAGEPRPERGRRSPRELLARFDQLVTAQRARSAAARSALIEHAALDQQELARVDSAVTRMNGKLAGYGEEAIAQAASDEPPSPAQALGLGHDVSGILFEAQKELDDVVGDKAEDVDPSALEIWNYVDVEQWRPYVEKQLAQGSQGATPGAAAPAPAAAEGAAGESAAPTR